jgi:methyl-accepting chemotaxis protein
MFLKSHSVETWSELEPVILVALERFYNFVQEHEEMAAIVDGHSIEKLKKVQLLHWSDTFENGLSNDYFERMDRIVRAHSRIGLSPGLFSKGYHEILNAVSDAAKATYPRNPRRVIDIVTRIQDLVMSDLSIIVEASIGHAETLRETDAEVTLSYANQFQSSMQSLQQDIEASASASQQLDSSFEQINSSVNNASRFSSDAATRANSASETMNEVARAAEEIGSFLSIITEIADKTKLLAVNAAIEAARAGEAGKGFTVVADEVRQLAEGTESGATDVARKVEEIQRAVAMLKPNIEGVQDSFAKVKSSTDEISSTVKEQSNSASEISSRMTNISQSVREQVSGLDKLVESIRASIT